VRDELIVDRYGIRALTRNLRMNAAFTRIRSNIVSKTDEESDVPPNNPPEGDAASDVCLSVGRTLLLLTGEELAPIPLEIGDALKPNNDESMEIASVTIATDETSNTNDAQNRKLSIPF